jgi:hypothetical protein
MPTRKPFRQEESGSSRQKPLPSGIAKNKPFIIIFLTLFRPYMRKRLRKKRPVLPPGLFAMVKEKTIFGGLAV